MLIKELTYKDFNGMEHKDILHFHLSKSRVLLTDEEKYNKVLTLAKELQDKATEVDSVKVDTTDDFNPFDPKMQVVANAARTMVQLLDLMVDLSYGLRSEDGSRFIQNEKVLEQFKSSAAYDQLIQDFINNPNDMLAFIESLNKTAN